MKTSISNPEPTYQGWTNRETWLVHLWLTNEYNTYQGCRGLNAYGIERYVDDIVASNGPTDFFLDLVNAALVRVDWDEIANAINE